MHIVKNIKVFAKDTYFGLKSESVSLSKEGFSPQLFIMFGK
jgi:hypothetical protein